MTATARGSGEPEYNSFFKFLIGIGASAFVFFGAYVLTLLLALPLGGVFWIALNALQLAGVSNDQSAVIASILFLPFGFPLVIWVLVRIWVPMFFCMQRDTCFGFCPGRYSFADAWALYRVVFSDIQSDWVRLKNVFR